MPAARDGHGDQCESSDQAGVRIRHLTKRECDRALDCRNRKANSMMGKVIVVGGGAAGMMAAVAAADSGAEV